MLNIVENCTHWTLLNIAHVEHCTSWTLLNIAHIKHCWTLLNIVEHCTCRTLPKHLESPAAQTSPCIQSPRHAPRRKKKIGFIIRQKDCSFFSYFPFLFWVLITILMFKKMQNMTAQKSNISALTKEKIMSEPQWYIPTLVPGATYMWVSNREKTTHGAGAECRELRASLHPVGRSLAGG